MPSSPAFAIFGLTLSGGGEWEQRPVDAAERSPLLRALSTEINEAESSVAAERAEAAAARQRQQEQEDRRSEKYARARSTHPLPLPKMPRLQRLGMVARVLVPRLTLRDKAIQQLLQIAPSKLDAIQTGSNISRQNQPHRCIGFLLKYFFTNRRIILSASPRSGSNDACQNKNFRYHVSCDHGINNHQQE